MKLLETMVICHDLENIFSIRIQNILIKSNCLKLINILGDVATNLAYVSFFIAEAKDRSNALGAVVYSYYIRRCQNTLAYNVCVQSFRGFSVFHSPYFLSCMVYLACV